MQALRRRIVFLVVFSIAVLAFAQVAHAHGNDDHAANANHSGNQGSVKVDDDDVDDTPANHPHVLCALAIVVEHGVGAPFDIDLGALSPTTRAGSDQRLLIVHVPAGDNLRGLVDLTKFLDGIAPQAQQGFHIVITVHLPGGDKHKVIWVGLCGPGATTSTTTGGATSTTAHGSTTTTANGATTSTTAQARISNGTSLTNTSIPTQVLGENFVKSPAADAAAATTLANTGSPFSPALAVVIVLGGLVLLGGARHLSGRRLELSMRRVTDRER